MKNKDYFNFHDHTIKSVRDGAKTVAASVKRAVELGYRRYCPTDHGTMASIYEVFKECEKYGGKIKPGIGLEFYLNLSNEMESRKSFHNTVIVLNDIGYQNLLKLQYLSCVKEDEDSIDGFKGCFYYKQRIHEKMLFHFSEGLLVTSGCRLSVFNQKILEGEEEFAHNLLHHFNEQCENFMIELHPHHNEIEEELFYKLKSFAYESNIPCIIANDSHYVMKSDLISWNLLGAARHNKTMSRQDEFIQNEDFHMQSYEEIFARVLELCDNNVEETEKLFSSFETLDSMITFNWYDTWANRQMPQLVIPDAEEKLEEKLSDLLIKKFGHIDNIPALYSKRLREEFDISIQTNNCSYYYFVSEFLQRCSSEEIMLSKGRGSAASLLICYLIGASDVDPILYPEMIIERAMNPDRKKLMDIDLDFSPADADRAIEILKEMMGSDCVVNIVNYGYNKFAQSIQHVAKILEIPPAKADEITKSCENYDDLLKHPYIQNYRNFNLTAVDVVDYVKRVEGTINNLSTHASGILVMNSPVWKHIPVIRVGKVLCSAFDMEALEDLHGLKIDILRVQVMSIIQKGLEKLFNKEKLQGLQTV